MSVFHIHMRELNFAEPATKQLGCRRQDKTLDAYVAQCKSILEPHCWNTGAPAGPPTKPMFM